MSSGWPARPSGLDVIIASRASFGMAAVIGVSMKPGRMPFTVVPNRASSSEPDRTRPTTPALDAM